MPQRVAHFLFLLALITYGQNVGPILDFRCVECHCAGNPRLDLSNFPFFSKFTENQAAIVTMILAKTGGAAPAMPPGNRPKLTPGQLSIIEQWRDQGLAP